MTAKKIGEFIVSVLGLGLTLGIGLSFGLLMLQNLQKLDSFVDAKFAAKEEPRAAQRLLLGGHTYLPGDKLSFKQTGQEVTFLRAFERSGHMIVQVRYIDSCNDPFVADMYTFELCSPYMPMLAPRSPAKKLVEAN